MMQTVAIVLSFAVTVVAVALLVQGLRGMLGVLRQGQATLGRTDRPGRRTVTMLAETFLHTRMLQWTWVGVMHWFVFAAFLILSTAVAAAYFQLFDPGFVWPVIGHWYPYEWVSELIGLLGTVGIVVLIVVRQRNHPRRLDRKSRFFDSTFWQAYFVEGMALLEASAILFVRGAEFNLGRAEGETDLATRAHFPLSSWIAGLYPDGAAASENLIYFIALFKIVLAMLFLIVIARNLTMGVAWHRFTAWFNIWFKRESSGRTALGAVKPLESGGRPITLDDIDELDEDAVLGAGSIGDFSWKGILDFTTCTECGRCQSQCPAWNTEKPLSPKLLVMGLRDHAYASARAGATAGEDGTAERSLVGKAGADDWFYNPEGGDFVIDEDVLWSCTNCGACVQQCPVDIEHVDHITDMRRYQTLVEANFPSELNGLFRGMENKGNPWNMSPTARMDWAQGLDVDVKVVGGDAPGDPASLDEVEWLFWVGCAGAYEDRAKKTTRAVAELLDMAGVSFAVLGNGETCTGDSARRAGNEFVFQGLAQQNIETFGEYRVKKVVSTCAHCFNTLKNEYREFGIELEVVHHTQLLNRLVREGRLTPVASGEGAHQRSITYHDPCFLGRHNQVYSPPRDLLQILPGAQYAEMERSNERSFCCGAGGARMWMEEKLGERINVDRTTEAVGTGADQIAVGCPFCRVMLSDGLTKLQADGTAREEVEVLDVAQMLLASVKGEVATKVKPGSGTPVAAAAQGAAPTAPEAPVSAAPAAGAAAGGSSLFDEAPAEPEATPAPSGGGSLFDDAGGSSLFDEAPAEAAPPAGGSLFDEPAAEPVEAEPAEGSGSLFDEGGSLFAAEESAPAAPEPAAPEPAEATDLGAGGSLFDVQPSESESARAAPEPAAPEPAATDLGAGGSLFDVQPSESESASPPAEPVESSSGPAASEPEPEPEPELGAGGSMFDIAAPDASPAAAEDAEQPAEDAAEPADHAEADGADDADQAGETEEKPSPKSSGATNTPRTDAEINESGSLFDL